MEFLRTFQSTRNDPSGRFAKQTRRRHRIRSAPCFGRWLACGLTDSSALVMSHNVTRFCQRLGRSMTKCHQKPGSIPRVPAVTDEWPRGLELNVYRDPSAPHDVTGSAGSHPLASDGKPLAATTCRECADVFRRRTDGGILTNKSSAISNRRHKRSVFDQRPEARCRESSSMIRTRRLAAFTYIRTVSYSECDTLQHDLSLSRLCQIERRVGVPITAQFADHGVSGRYASDRPQLERMLALFEQGEANTLYVEDLSRLARGATALAAILTRLLDASVAVWTFHGSSIEAICLSPTEPWRRSARK